MSLSWGQKGPPPEVTLLYREVGKTHVFTADHDKLRGFHIGSSDLSRAFHQAAIALGEHVSRVFGCSANYTLEISFTEFQERLGKDHDVQHILAGGLLIAKRDESRVAAPALA